MNRHFHCSSRNPYDWLPRILSSNFPGPIIIGGNFNAKSALCCYSTCHLRGKSLEQASEFSQLPLRNKTFFATLFAR